MQDAIIKQFWEAPDDALFTREELAAIRRCSIAKIEREAWEKAGIPFLKDGNRALYRKRDVVAYLNGAYAGAGAA